MDLSGQLSNPSVKSSWERLASVLASMRAGDAPPRPSDTRRSVRKRGEVRESITRLLGGGEEPMRAREIHRAVERELGADVSWSSIANCLARNAHDTSSRFERVAVGRYRLR